MAVAISTYLGGLTMSSKKVVVIGSLNYDINVKQERMPQKGETCFGNELILGAGGKGSNQAAACALLGLDTAMVGCVGQDLFGAFLKNELRRNGVDVTYVKERGSSGTGLVHVMPDGDYYSTVIKGANYLLTEEDIDEAFPVISEANYVIFQQEIPHHLMEYTLNKLEGHDAITILNNAPAKKVKPETLAKIDYLIVNETEASFMAEETIEDFAGAAKIGTLLQKSVRKGVVITLGEKGSVAISAGKIYNCHPCLVNAVDATGAGDSYIGAFTYGLSTDMGMQENMEFASAVSALTVMNCGGQSSFPNLKQVQDYITSNKNSQKLIS